MYLKQNDIGMQMKEKSTLLSRDSLKNSPLIWPVNME